MILTHLQKNIRGIFLALSGLFGLALGTFCAALLGLFLQSEPAAPAAEKTRATRPAAQATLNDYRDILKRDVFNSAGGNLSFAPGPARQSPSAPSQAPVSDWELVGTISGGPTPLATLRSQGETRAYRQGGDLPGGGKLSKVERSRVTITLPDGREQILALPEKGKGKSTKTRTATSSRQKRAGQRQPAGTGIRALGENRWQINRGEAEKARANIGELLKQARLEPNLINGQTAGFAVKMIQPGTLLSQLGLKVGDVLHEVNGVPLDSPEKALQVFQQLRQARQVNIALERGGATMTFSYDID